MAYRSGIEELNENIAKARAMISRRLWLQKQESAAKEKLDELKEKRETLGEQLAKEQKDVDKLEGKGLTALFASMLGSKEEKLEKERQELLAAKLIHDEALAEISEVESQIQAMEIEIQGLENVDRDLVMFLHEKESWIKEHGGIDAKELFELADRAGEISAQLAEVREASSAGRAALEHLRGLVTSLQSSKDWGTFDMLGGGLIATSIKHSKMDEAQRQVPAVQAALGIFQRELRDVRLELDVDIELDSFDRFADYFFDGLIFDWSVQSKITRSLEKVQSVVMQVENYLGKLDGWYGHLTDQHKENVRRRREIIEQWG